MTSTELAAYFELDDKANCVRFIGEKCECFIPMRYADKNLLMIKDKIIALGTFTMHITDRGRTIVCGLQIPAIITIDPVETREENIKGKTYCVCVLEKGSRLMCSLNVMQENKMGYNIWLEFLSTGNLPEYMNYSNIYTLCDNLKDITGKGIKVDHSMLEIIYAHMFRDADDLTKFYRYTDQKKAPAVVNLSDMGYGPSSTHSRIIGAWSDVGRTSAMLNQSESNHELEDFFRM